MTHSRRITTLALAVGLCVHGLAAPASAQSSHPAVSSDPAAQGSAAFVYGSTSGRPADGDLIRDFLLMFTSHPDRVFSALERWNSMSSSSSTSS
ncbi:hypothetical protein C1Y63_05620 [Corynebacterium sp. 13CS0277]|uniref:hypothetical protein n=1 Tax=Corynebacterium sp. 13CS0277 TaxID=2071994 RepID=UPI000D032B85|nr:hypothetical protein [Corynebacterium sp. 13CS0277]PRQ11482.1 hypothetical protein C1Y63_05620 [Corynebacterium sp. 13CS0277]